MTKIKLTRSTARTVLTVATSLALAGCPMQAEQKTSAIKQSSTSQAAEALIPKFNTTEYVLKAGDSMTGSLNVAGNLGVGTTSPQSPFHLVAPFVPAYMQMAIKGTATDDRAGISFWNSSDGRIASMYADSVAGSNNGFYMATENGASPIYMLSSSVQLLALPGRQNPNLHFSSSSQSLGDATHSIFGPFNTSSGVSGAFYFGVGRNSKDNSRNRFIFYNTSCTPDTVGQTDYNCNASGFDIHADVANITGRLGVGVGAPDPKYALDIGGTGSTAYLKVGGRGAFTLAAEAACLAMPAPGGGQGARNLVWEPGTTRTCAQACAAASVNNVHCLGGWTMWNGEVHFQYTTECTAADPSNGQSPSGKLCCCNNTNHAMPMYGN